MRENISAVIFICLLFRLGETEAAAQSLPPPRGYCAPLSRVVPQSSPCRHHLIAGLDDAAGSGQEEWAELVYVRLETLGTDIRDLRTVAINERLLSGVLGKLLDLNAAFDDESSSRRRQQDALAHVRAQLQANPSLPEQEEDHQPDKCRSAMLRFLCRLAYPTCHFRRADVSALVRPPCREDCMLLRDALCPNLNWREFGQALSLAFNSTLKANINELGIHVQDRLQFNESSLTPHLSYQQQQQQQQPSFTLNSSIHFYWPHERSIENCESLPTARRRIARKVPVRWPACSNAHLSRSLPPKAANAELPAGGKADCLVSKDGVDYNGQRNHTRSGLVCQHWSSQTPHKHTSSELLFDNMREARNHCRNPGGTELKPWCYTQDPSVRWEYCEIEMCH